MSSNSYQQGADMDTECSPLAVGFTRSIPADFLVVLKKVGMIALCQS